MWLSEFRTVLPDAVLPRGSVRIEGGKIAEIIDGPAPGGCIIAEGRGQLLLTPGLIDMHGDMIEREVEPRPNVPMPMELGLRCLDQKLAAAGVTTAYASLSFSPASAYGHMRSYEHTSGIIRALRAMRGDLLVDHLIHARFEITFPRALDIVRELIAEGSVDLVSLTDHTPGQGQYRDIEKHVERLAQEHGVTREQAAQRVARRIADRSEGAEVMTATLDAISEVCARHDVPLASHDDDTEDKVRLMKGLGARISEFPVSIEAAEAAHEAGLAVAMGAPNALRGGSYSGNLSAREAHEAGLLDMLAADYHPASMLPAALILGERDPDGLPGAIRLVSGNPARALGLQDRGEIATGLRADLTIADPRGIGHVRAVYREGRLIYADGALVSEAVEPA